MMVDISGIEMSLFHDLLRLPILDHYVWSELTGRNSLQKIVDFYTIVSSGIYSYIPLQTIMV